MNDGKNMKVETKYSEKEPYSLRDVYDELKKGREFEISNLWQRSVFLATFMIAVAGGYGTYMKEIISWKANKTDIKQISGKVTNTSETHGDYKNCKKASIDIKKTETLEVDLQIHKSGNEEEITEYKKEEWEYGKNKNKSNSFEFDEDDKQNPEQEAVPILLTYLGIVFSMLWVMMAKGSKYWTERYELATDMMIENREFNPNIDDTKIPCHGNLPDLESKKISNYILSPLAGRYSPSKINITIGIMTLIFWGILNIFHIFKVAQKYLDISMLHSFFISVVFAFLTYFFIYLVLAIYCKSGE